MTELQALPWRSPPPPWLTEPLLAGPLGGGLKVLNPDQLRVPLSPGDLKSAGGPHNAYVSSHPSAGLAVTSLTEGAEGIQENILGASHVLLGLPALLPTQGCRSVGSQPSPASQHAPYKGGGPRERPASCGSAVQSPALSQPPAPLWPKMCGPEVWCGVGEPLELSLLPHTRWRPRSPRSQPPPLQYSTLCVQEGTAQAQPQHLDEAQPLWPGCSKYGLRTGSMRAPLRGWLERSPSAGPEGRSQQRCLVTGPQGFLHTANV